ncbi:hypothetical protein PIB30_079861 [Stylosanthes scabra]|uniref:Uncharacterized protein n=1 Tax=Stylosanthes scabra TaxID=79078 RepID=A0ABU6TSL0_9FABA|nr:hypothetical protein [Stylosanthes scabra]
MCGSAGPSTNRDFQLTVLGTGVSSHCANCYLRDVNPTRIEVVARVIPRAGNLRFSPLSSYITQNLLSSFLPHSIMMRSILPGSSVPRLPRPSTSPTSSSSSSYKTSGGVPCERDRSPRAPVYPSPRVPMMDVRHYRSLFGQRWVVPPSPQHDASEPSEEAFEEHDDTHTYSDTSHSSVDIFSVDASQGSNRESISFDSGPSSHLSFDSGSSGRWSGSTISTGNISSEDDLVSRHFAGTFPPPMP